MLYALFVICIILVLCRSIKTHEIPLILWGGINISYIQAFYYSEGSYGFTIPLIADCLIMALISTYKTLSRLSYYILMSTLVSSIVNLSFCFLYLLNIHEPEVYRAFMFAPLALILTGFFGGGRFERKSADSYNDNSRFAFDRFNYKAINAL